MESKTYEERSWEAENKVEKLEELLIACRGAMVIDMGNRGANIGCDWSHMINAIEDAVHNAETTGDKEEA